MTINTYTHIYGVIASILSIYSIYGVTTDANNKFFLLSAIFGIILLIFMYLLSYFLRYIETLNKQLTDLKDNQHKIQIQHQKDIESLNHELRACYDNIKQLNTVSSFIASHSIGREAIPRKLKDSD